MRTKLLLVVAAATLVAGVAAPATGKERFRLWDCMTQAVVIQLPAQQLQEHLPQGFKVAPGPVGNSQVANAYVESWACGPDPKNPNVVAAHVNVPVDPPEDQTREESLHRFTLAATIAGADVKKFSRDLCAVDLFDQGEISVTNGQWTTDVLGVSNGTTRVRSDDLAFDMDLEGAGFVSETQSRTRMFYEVDGEIRRFDLTKVNQFNGLGASLVTFTEPFLDFPSHAAGLGLHARVWMSLDEACSDA